MNKKILFSIIGFLILLVGVYIFSHNSIEKDKEMNSNPSSNFIYIGNATSGPWTEIYSGSAVVTGSFRYTKGPNVHLEENFTFIPDINSKIKLPENKLVEDSNFNIYSPNRLKMFNLPEDTCYAMGKAQIEIEGFRLLKAEIGGSSSAKLVKVNYATTSEVKTISEYGIDCGFF